MNGSKYDDDLLKPEPFTHALRHQYAYCKPKT